MWDKCKLVVVIIRTKRQKTEYLRIIKQKFSIQRIKFYNKKHNGNNICKKALDLVTLNSSHNAYTNTVKPNHNFTQSLFSFHIFDILLPQCKQGFVYMLNLLRIHRYTYIGETMYI